MIRKVPRFVRNFYFLVAAFFIFWMLFIDSNDFYSQYKKRKKLHDLQAQKAYYQQMIKEVKMEREELMSNDKLLEKFAREKYLMKKGSEDLYVIVPDK